MTITVKVHVNGNYRATVKRSVNGEPCGEPVIVNPQEEKTIPFNHGETNIYEITEEPVAVQE